jgi:pimeloyl-ACP methyl ester carboxylesterase
VKGRRATAVLAILAALGCAASGCTTERGERQGGSPGARTGAPAGLEGFYAQRLSWRDCGGGFGCSSLQVPLDYSKPAGERLRIAVIRLPAVDQDQRIGSLVLNPGGPGTSGIQYARAAPRVVSAALRQRFDIVGFDPRGVGQSDPIRCLSARDLDQYYGADSSPDDEADRRELISVSRRFAEGCGQRARNMLPRIGTLDAARDMDVLRAVLGDDGLTYLGKSYGTYLGAFYAEQFPKRVRALVLDGAVDPQRQAMEINIEQGRGFETALRAFVADCMRRPDCPLGTGGVDAGVNQISALLERSDRRPLANSLGDGREADEPLVALGIAASLYSKETWPDLRIALQQAQRGDGAVLLGLGDQLVERSENGEYSNQTEANMAVNCIDRPFPGEVEEYGRQAAKAREQAPRFGSFVVWGSLPCAYWPARGTQRPHPLRAAGSKPIVVVGTTRDPATPYKWSQGLAGQLENGVLLTLDGDGHTAYLTGSGCIDAAVDRYVIDGKPPANNQVCR